MEPRTFGAGTDRPRSEGGSTGRVIVIGPYVRMRRGEADAQTQEAARDSEARLEEATGLAALFSGLFSNRQVNRPSRGGGSGGSGSMPDFSNMPSGGDFPGGGSFPGGSGGSGGWPGGGSRGN